MTETFFSGEDKEPKLKRKQLNALYDNPIYTGFHACEINVESIKNHTIHFEQNEIL